MARNSTISVQITGDASKLKRVLGDTESRMSKFGNKLKSAGKVAGLALAGMGTAAVIAAPKILEAGAQLDALAAKSKVVFEDSLGSVQRWADENAAAMGLTSAQLVGLAASTGDLLKPMGLTAEAAADMAMETNDLAGALSAWTGGQRSAAEVSEILTKAYLGEREGLKSLGISITEAEVSARLLEKGQQDLTGEMLAQAKAIAAQELIMEKSTDAQKAWADGSMDGVKAQNEARASIERVKESLVVALAPAIEAVLPFIEQLATWIGENLPKAVERIKLFVERDWPKIRDTIVNTVRDIWEKVEPYWNTIYAIVEGTITAIRGVIKTVTSLIKGDWSSVWDGIKQIFEGVWNAMKGFVTGAINAMKDAIKIAMGVLKVAWQLAWNGVKQFVSNTWDAISNTVKGAIDKVVGFVQGIGARIAAFASGMFGPAITAAEAMIAVLQGIIDMVDRTIAALNRLNPGNFNNLDTSIVNTGSGIASQLPTNTQGSSGGTSFQSRGPAPASVTNNINVTAMNPLSAAQMVSAEIERNMRVQQ